MLKHVYALLCALALIGLVGCGGGAPEKEAGTKKKKKKSSDEKTTTTTADKPSTPSATEAYSKDKGTASIKGVVKWEGDPAKRPQIDTSGDAKCHAMHKDKALTKEEVVTNDGKLQNAIVYVKSGAEKWTYETPSTPATLDQKGCQYMPHVIAVMVDQPIVIRNSDDLAHNVHATGNQEFNISQSKQGQEDKKKFSEPEFVPIKCDIHKWMQAYAGVFAHPFFAVTKEDGSFEITGLPPGEYELAVWHESPKVAVPPPVKVTVADKEAKTQEFTAKAK